MLPLQEQLWLLVVYVVCSLQDFNPSSDKPDGIYQLLMLCVSVLQGPEPVAAVDPGSLLPQVAGEDPNRAGAAESPADLRLPAQPAGGAVEGEP